MNQYFRRITFAVLACIGGLGFIGSAWSAPLEAVRYITAYDCAGYGYAEAKFQAEVVSQALAEGQTGQAIRSDLRRDSHGFRMASVDDLDGFAPA